MAMHRRQSFDVSARSVAVAAYSTALHGVFRRAVGYALASALGASGCYGSADPLASEASQNGAAGMGQDPSSGGMGGSRASAGTSGGAAPEQHQPTGPVQPNVIDAGSADA